jgi:RsiW-degrading membrane proteinase PrsW (M82 family)
MEVPNANFCGACGAHLGGRADSSIRRYHAYAALPEEPVLRLAIVTSLFPHLSRHTKIKFQTAVALISVALIALALGRAEAAVIAVAALGIPLLFVLYIVEIDDPSRTAFRVPIMVTIVLGAALGVGWGWIGGHYVNEALAPSFDFTLTQASSLVGAVVVPAVGVLLTIIPVALIRLRSTSLTEALDGFVVGTTGALGFALAATITQLSSLLRDGEVTQLSFTSTLTQAVIRGITTPILAGITIGLVGTTLWVRRRDDAPSRRRWLTMTVTAMAFAILLQVGLGFADVDNLVDSELMVVHLAALVLAIVVVRLCLHHTLLHERHDASVGAPQICGNCHHLVPTMPFCPECGVARRATSPRHRARALELDDGASSRAT